MSDNKNKKRTLPLPNTKLPFFAYGIFKPGQLAYSKIRNHVDKTKNMEIDYEMRLRDGVPILTSNESKRYPTKGTLITFREGQEEETYSIICKTLLSNLYEWKTIKINGNAANVVFGVNPDMGSDYILEPEKRGQYNGKDDPFFSDVIRLLDENLNSEKSFSNRNNFFELQMNYMLLWSAIDRFSKIKYNRNSQGDNLERFAIQKPFKEGIRKFKDNYHRAIFSTDDLKMHCFNAEKPKDTIHYYYTLRCNVVHRGKDMGPDYHLLEVAARELLELFKNILKNTFDEP